MQNNTNDAKSNPKGSGCFGNVIKIRMSERALELKTVPVSSLLTARKKRSLLFRVFACHTAGVAL